MEQKEDNGPAEKSAQTMKQKSWADIEKTLLEDGILKNGIVRAEKVEASQFPGALKERGVFYSSEIKRKFEDWGELPEKPAPDLFLSAHFPKYRAKTYTEHLLTKAGTEIDGKLATTGKLDATVGAGVYAKTQYGDSAYGAGIQYGIGENQPGFAANIRGAYLQIGAEQRLGVRESLIDAFLNFGKDGFGLVLGTSAGPFGYGFNFIGKTMIGGFNVFVAGFDFVMTTINKAEKISKEDGSGFWRELGKILISPIEIGKIAFEVLVVKPVLKVKDFIDSIFKSTKPKKTEISEVEYNREMVYVMRDEGYGNFHSAKKKLETLLQRDLDPISRADAQNFLERIKYRMAFTGLPFAINAFEPSTFLRFKRKMADGEVGAGIKKSIARLEELTAKGRLSEGEQKEFAYHYNYLFTKNTTKTSREGYKIPVYPVPDTTLNHIIRCLEKGKKTYYGIVAGKMVEISQEISKGGANYREIMKRRAWEIKLVAGEMETGRWAIKDEKDRSNLSAFVNFAGTLAQNENLAKMDIEAYEYYRNHAELGIDEKITQFYEGALLEKCRAHPQSAVRLATAHLNRIKNSEDEEKGLAKELAENKDSSKAREIESKMASPRENAENEKGKLACVLEMSQKAGIESSFRASDYSEMKKYIKR